MGIGKKRRCLYSHSLTLSPHCSHLPLIFRPVKWPLLWCLQVSEGRSLPGSSSVLLTRLRLHSSCFLMLRKEAEAKQHIHSCQVVFPLLNATLTPISIITSHSLSLSLSMNQFFITQKVPAHTGCFSLFVCHASLLSSFQIQIVNTEALI